MIHLLTFKLARLFNKSGITCNVLEPGVIETKLLRLVRKEFLLDTVKFLNYKITLRILRGLITFSINFLLY